MNWCCARRLKTCGCLLGLLATAPAGADIRVEKAVVPLTHEAVAHAYPEQVGGFPVVGDPAAAPADRWADLVFRYHFTIRNTGADSATVRVVAERPADFGIAKEFRSEPEQAELAPGQAVPVTLIIEVPGEAAADLPAGYMREIGVRFTGVGFDDVSQRVVFWVPAVAKILAGAAGKGLPADVFPDGADYADDFSGGWDGSRFTGPFLMGTKAQVADWRKTVAQGLQPDWRDQYWHFGNPGVMGTLAEIDPGTIAARERGHETHSPTGEAMLNLALAWAYTGDKTMAEKAGKLILGYVDRAKQLGFGQSGRVGVNGLSDAWFCNPVFRAIDLLAVAETFTDEEVKRIHHWMLYQASVIRPQVFGFNNMQCEANFPVMAAGLVAGDFKYLRFAYYPPYGMQGQLSGAFYADGFHREKQSGYHYRSINPVTDQAEALLRLGFSVYDKRLHRALINPVRRTAAPGDDLGGQDVQACQIASLRYRDSLAADWLKLNRRQERLPLFHRALPLPEPSAAYWQQPATHMPLSGQTILRTGDFADDLRAVRLHWGFPGKRQGRDFMDCSFLYRGRGFGGGDYGVNESLGHGVVIVNEQSMHECGGFPLEMELEGEFPYIVAANPGPQELDDTYGAEPWPYPWSWPDAGRNYGTFLPLAVSGNRERQWTAMYEGAVWTRTVAAINGGFLVADQVVLEAPARIDRPLHLGAGLNSLKELTLSIPLKYEPGAIGSTPQYLAAIPGIMPLPPTMTSLDDQENDRADTTEWIALEDEGRNDKGPTGPEFPQAATDDMWTATAFNQHGGHSFNVRGTILGMPGTRIVKVHALPLGWGYHDPFLIVRRDDVAHARFVVFIEPYNGRGASAHPRLLGMKQVPATTTDGRKLTDREATAVELDFGEQRVIAILNDSAEAVQAGALRTEKRFAAESLTP